ncbi:MULTISPECIES: FadR/GntR family transcriptional regulator [unclassified Crossiella]|uniref:FadR/GntR family transcriptional regulator n=1 Tax=unclassified Crossiella TaxID=2620835 RepID=UPI001FFF3ED8|nr:MULTISPECIES: FCD domain-containing protein [unclassified Crossiella]MCK2236517.1 FCD domain-containing protein [Crossiella sp. S99.2]MCK2250184.1 FCD domain-containing protein [Crossiella sp. S99.1]
MTQRGLHGQLLDQLGQAITSGAIPGGRVLRIEELATQHGVSRTVAREAVRVLEAMRLVHSRPKVGTTVRPRTEWNLFDPQVVRWRLGSTQRGEQLRQLSHVRAAVEPAAGSLAAVAASPEQRAELLALAAELGRLAERGEVDQFVEVDVRFHRLVLTASGNEMFAHLGDFTAELLRGRNRLHLMPAVPDAVATQRHVEVARAIAQGQPDRAEELLRQIVAGAAAEVAALLTRK